MATPNDPRYFRDGTPRDGVLRNRNPLETPSTAPRAATAPTQGSVTLPFADGRTPTGRTDAELAAMAATQSAAADAGIARRRLDDRMGRTPIAEGTLGYFVGSDGRKQTFTPESAQAKAATLPTSNTMPAGIALGDGNFAASNDARRTAGTPAAAAAPQQAAADASDAARYQAALASGMGPRAAMESLGAPTPPPTGTPSSVTTPTGVSTVAAGTLARRSPVDEFNDIRAGLARPGMYDPSGATSRARGAATSVVRSNSDANRILQMAANLASDPRLKGFPGARNAIIQGLVGQIGADSSAALEGLRQTGQAGISAQGFDQDGVLQETGRRGQVLRDQFLAENEERLARINNDADMAQIERSGEFQLEAANARRRESSNAARKEDNRRADDALRAAQEKFPDDPVAAALAAERTMVAQGIDPEQLYSGNEVSGVARRNVIDRANESRLLGLGNAIDNWLVGSDGNSTLPEDFDFSSENIDIDADDSFLLDFQQFLMPYWAQPYSVATTDPATGERVTQVVRPQLFGGENRAPNVREFRELQRNRDLTLSRRPQDGAGEDFY